MMTTMARVDGRAGRPCIRRAQPVMPRFVRRSSASADQKMTQYGASLQILKYVSVAKSYGLKSALFPSEEKNN
jgi:hypothetical protein